TMETITRTEDLEYTHRLIRLQNLGWKRLLDVQAPYRWNIRRLRPGFVLDIGCGIGRNLLHLNGYGEGVDHNPHSVQVCKERGLTVFVPEEFERSQVSDPRTFDSLLLSHVAEHMNRAEATNLLRAYLPYLKPGGRAIVVTPQEAGFKSDASHIEFMDHARVGSILTNLGFEVLHAYSFPFPRPAGRLFLYNEFITVGKQLLERDCGSDAHNVAKQA